MIKYKFSMRLPGSNEAYEYVLDLQQEEEDNPDIVFSAKRREQVRESLQRQSTCKIDDNALTRIVKIWKQDIAMGSRNSSITIDLPLLADSQIDDLREEGNQAIPALFKPDLSGIEPQFGALPPLIFQ
jgi:hypothetical protein